ncbi:MAG: hypothetical protein AAF618_10405 [Pseudomonadota bacterium]
MRHAAVTGVVLATTLATAVHAGALDQAVADFESLCVSPLLEASAIGVGLAQSQDGFSVAQGVLLQEETNDEGLRACILQNDPSLALSPIAVAQAKQAFDSWLTTSGGDFELRVYANCTSAFASDQRIVDVMPDDDGLGIRVLFVAQDNPLNLYVIAAQDSALMQPPDCDPWEG